MVWVRSWKLSTTSAILLFKLNGKAVESPYKKRDYPHKPGQHINENSSFPGSSITNTKVRSAVDTNPVSIKESRPGSMALFWC